jgi:hypothetical protein
LEANSKPIGKYKSSGILISTGTGSSGWLYGAKRMTNREVRNVIEEIKTYKDVNGQSTLELGQTCSFLEDELAN